MVNTTDICRIAVSISILMTLSSSVSQTTREKVSLETLYADRVAKVFTDRIALSPSQPSRETYYCDSSGCIRQCGAATCAVDIIGKPTDRAMPP